MSAARQSVEQVGRTDRPRLALRVGVTGHRTDRLQALARAAGGDSGSYETRLGEALEGVLAAVAAASEACRDDPGSPFSDRPPLVRVVVGAAYGVDRIAARTVDERLRGPRAADDREAPSPSDCPTTEWRIETILPAPLTLTAEAAWADFAAANNPNLSAEEMARTCAEDWRLALAPSDTVTALPASWRVSDEPAATPPLPLDHFAPFAPVERPGPGFRLSYVEAANFQLEQIDLLVAVWDGLPSRGPGGVADIAAHALAGGKPVVLIDAARLDLPPRMLRSVEYGRDRPNVVGWSPQPLEAVFESADCRDGALADAIRVVVALPGEIADGHAEAHGHAPVTLADFYGERLRPRPRSDVYQMFVGALIGFSRRRGRGHAGHSRSESEWAGFVAAVADHAGLADDINAIVRRRYVAASTLANIYAGRYRSALVSAFLLGAFASLVAVTGWAVDLHLLVKIAPVAEIMVIGLVLFVVAHGRRARYHAKYIAYRTLAESLHSLRSMACLGEGAGLFAQTAGLDAWHRWYVQCTVRELSLPNVTLDATYQRRILKAVKQYDIDSQIAYHAQNAEMMMIVDRNIHRLGSGLFFGVGAALLGLVYVLFRGHEISSTHDPWHVRAMHVVAAFLPALGSALAGIRFMADFDGRAMRSVQMTEALGALGARVDGAIERQDFTETRATLRDLAVTLSQDVSQFRAMYSRRELVLPS